MVSMEDEILTLTELQEYLKIPKPTLYSLAQRGDIPAAKVGRHWRFKRAEIKRWFQTLQAKPKKKPFITDP